MTTQQPQQQQQQQQAHHRRPRVLFPLPDTDFDTTESAVAYDLLHNEFNIDVQFATENGSVPRCDARLLTGVICGQLGAERDAIECYQRMLDDVSYNAPIRWSDVQPHDYDGLWLSGGHAPGMRQYLGSSLLQLKVAQFFALKRPVGAICHGPLVLARALDPQTNRSVLHGYRTMSLPYWMEQSAYFLTCCCLGKYYRTYDMYVEDEMKAVLANPTEDYINGPRYYIRSPPRGTRNSDEHACVHIDRHYCSARWPGDTYMLARTFGNMVLKCNS